VSERPEIALLRAGYEAFNRGDWGMMFESAAPDFEFVAAERSPNRGTYRGAAAAKRVLEDLFEPFEEVSSEPEEFLVAPDSHIVTLVAMRYRPRGSSALVEMRIAHVWTFRDGLATRMEVFPRPEDALEATGLGSVST
jgi:ketosteroid isomerase-like protein